MTSLSMRFARAVARGRAAPTTPATRAGLLATLLRKRATAQSVGATDLEAMLRSQILWALPTFERITDEVTSAAIKPAVQIADQEVGQATAKCGTIS